MATRSLLQLQMGMNDALDFQLFWVFFSFEGSFLCTYAHRVNRAWNVVKSHMPEFCNAG